MRLLARLITAVHFPRNLLFTLGADKLALYRLWSSRTENNLRYFSPPGSSCRCHPPNTFRSGRAQPPKRERLGFPDNLRGARVRRTRCQKDADCGPPPEEHPLTSTRSLVSLRHKFHGDPRSRTGLQSGEAIVRKGAQRLGIKVLYILHLIGLNTHHYQKVSHFE